MQYLLGIFETGIHVTQRHYVSEDDLELLTLLPPWFKC